MTGASGTGYANFTFKVNDGTVDSASAYTMTIDVTDAPALACAAPDLAGRNQIWTGEMTVETLTGFGVTFLHGFDTTDVGGAPAGALDNRTFNIGSNAYTINSVFVYARGVIEGDLQFSLASELTFAEVDALRLHVCGTDYDLSAVTTLSTSIFIWPDNLDWSSIQLPHAVSEPAG